MKTMKTYQISNSKSGTIIGNFPGATEAEALEAMARDAGYRDYAECCEAAPVAEGQIVLTEVADYIVVSGEGAGEGHLERAAMTAKGAAQRLAAERCGGDRWARAYRLVGAIGHDTEDGSMRDFESYLAADAE